MPRAERKKPRRKKFQFKGVKPERMLGGMSWHQTLEKSFRSKYMLSRLARIQTSDRPQMTKPDPFIGTGGSIGPGRRRENEVGTVGPVEAGVPPGLAEVVAAEGALFKGRNPEAAQLIRIEGEHEDAAVG